MQGPCTPSVPRYMELGIFLYHRSCSLFLNFPAWLLNVPGCILSLNIFMVTNLSYCVYVGVSISFSRGSSWPRDQTCISCVSCLAGGFFTCWDFREAPNLPNIFYFNNKMRLLKPITCYLTSNVIDWMYIPQIHMLKSYPVKWWY